MTSETMHTGKLPTAERIFATLIRLLEDQEGVKITYRIVTPEETKGTGNNE